MSQVSHEILSIRLVAQTAIIFVALAVMTVLVYSRIESSWKWLALAPLIIAQGLWFDRLYTSRMKRFTKSCSPKN